MVDQLYEGAVVSYKPVREEDKLQICFIFRCSGSGSLFVEVIIRAIYYTSTLELCVTIQFHENVYDSFTHDSVESSLRTCSSFLSLLIQQNMVKARAHLLSGLKPACLMFE